MPRAVDDLDRLARALEQSGDSENPPPDRVAEIFRDTRTIAVVGLSRDPAKAARRVPSYLAAKGYDVIPVNPNAERILGKEAVDRLSQVEEEVDMVLVFRPSDEAGSVIRDAAARPERPVIWLQEGIRNDLAAREAREKGITVVQDLCSFKAHRALGLG